MARVTVVTRKCTVVGELDLDDGWDLSREFSKAVFVIELMELIEVAQKIDNEES